MTEIELYVLAAALGILLLLLIYMKYTDPLVGCGKYRDGNCDDPFRKTCNFPDCDESKKYTPITWFIW